MMVSDKLVQNGDAIPTMMKSAGLNIPEEFDLKILPDLPISNRNFERDYIWGATDLGIMVRTRDWKLSVYKTGEMHLANLKDDPHEQADFSDRTECQSILRDLYLVMMREVIDGMQKRNRELLIPFGDKEIFGKRGWQRPFPCPY